MLHHLFVERLKARSKVYDFVMFLTGGWKSVFEPRVVAWLGILAPLCAVTFIGISIILSPWFSWRDNALSDLGISPVAPIFNSGLIITGFLVLMLSITFARVERENKQGFTGAVALLIMSFSTIGAGVFTENMIELHIIFSLLTFTSLIISSILLGLRFYSEETTKTLGILALLSAVASIITVAALSQIVALPGAALYEVAIGVPSLPWFIAVTLRLRKQ